MHSRTLIPNNPQINITRPISWASLVAQTVTNPPAMQETWVRSLCWEDSLEDSTAIHSSILAWRIPMERSLAGYSPWSCKELDTTEHARVHTHTHPYITDSAQESVEQTIASHLSAMNSTKIFQDLTYSNTINLLS